MYCECGCGGVTNVAKRDNKTNGHVAGQHVRFIHGHGMIKRWRDRARYIEEDRGYDTPCWIWQGYVGTDGYGEVTKKTGENRTRIAHRRYYEDHVGEIPAGFKVHHKCRVRCCVNPEHLEAVSPREHGSQHARVTDDQVREMRFRHYEQGVMITFLAKEYGISYQHARLLIRGHRRSHA